jgi:hypothetical protein
MARCPFAAWRPLTENSTQGRIDPTQAILHSAADGPGRTSLWGFFEHSSNLESHFYIYMDGTIEQYLDTTVRGDANNLANVRAISIETEDDGLEQPWSAAQVASIKRLLDWICDVHPKVARRQCPAWDQPGIGWHVMFGAPGPWTPVSKSCPRAARIPQIPAIIAAVAAGNPAPTPTLPKGFLMALTDDQQDWAAARIKETLELVRSLAPFSPERIDRSGTVVSEGGVIAHPTVRWQMEAISLARGSADVVRDAVKVAVAAAVIAPGAVDPDAVADAVIAKLKEKL